MVQAGTQLLQIVNAQLQTTSLSIAPSVHRVLMQTVWQSIQQILLLVLAARISYGVLHWLNVFARLLVNTIALHQRSVRLVHPN